MKNLYLLIITLTCCRITFSQDTVINQKTFKSLPDYCFDMEKLLLKIIPQLDLDYWEYRLGYDDYNGCPVDSIGCLPFIIRKYDVINHGIYKNIKDSLLLSKINCENGFWPILPSNDDYYLVYTKSNYVGSIFKESDLIEFIKPLDTFDKQVLFLILNNYGLLMYKKANANYEFIVFDSVPKKNHEKKNRHFYLFDKLYVIVDNDGILYQKRIGDYKRKIETLIIP